MASASEILSGGRADLGMVQSGAPVTNERAVDQSTQFINGLAQNLNFAQMQQNSQLFEQKVKDRDAMLKLFASGQSALGAVDPKYRKDFEEQNKAATEAFNNMKGINDKEGYEKYVTASQKLAETAALAQHKTALKLQDEAEAKKIQSPTLREQALKAIDENYKKGLNDEWTPFVPNIQVDVPKLLGAYQPSGYDTEQGVKTETVTTQEDKPTKDVVKTQIGKGGSTKGTSAGANVKNTKNYMQTTTASNGGNHSQSADNADNFTESKYVTLSGLKDDKGQPIKVAYDTKTTSTQVYNTNEVIKKVDEAFATDPDQRYYQQQVVNQLLTVSDPSQESNLLENVDNLNIRLKEAAIANGQNENSLQLEYLTKKDANGKDVLVKGADGKFVLQSKSYQTPDGKQIVPSVLNTPQAMSRLAIASHGGSYKTTQTTETLDKYLLKAQEDANEAQAKLALDRSKNALMWRKWRFHEDQMNQSEKIANQKNTDLLNATYTDEGGNRIDATKLPESRRFLSGIVYNPITGKQEMGRVDPIIDIFKGNTRLNTKGKESYGISYDKYKEENTVKETSGKSEFKPKETYYDWVNRKSQQQGLTNKAYFKASYHDDAGKYVKTVNDLPKEYQENFNKLKKKFNITEDDYLKEIAKKKGSPIYTEYVGADGGVATSITIYEGEKQESNKNTGKGETPIYTEKN